MHLLFAASDNTGDLTVSYGFVGKDQQGGYKRQG